MLVTKKVHSWSHGLTYKDKEKDRKKTITKFTKSLSRDNNTDYLPTIKINICVYCNLYTTLSEISTNTRNLIETYRITLLSV